MNHFLAEAYVGRSSYPAHFYGPAPLRRALRAIAKARRGPCPDVVRLMVYTAGHLDAAATEEVREHLGYCGTCARQVLRFLDTE